MRKIFIGLVIGIIGTMAVVLVFNSRENKKVDPNFPDSESQMMIIPEKENTDETDNSSANLAECVNNMTKKIGENPYAQGSILVSFKKGTAYFGALSILNSFGLTEKKIHEKELTFDNNPWLSVNVPVGQEINLACKVQENSNVTYSYVNSILELHE